MFVGALVSEQGLVLTMEMGWVGLWFLLAHLEPDDFFVVREVREYCVFVLLWPPLLDVPASTQPRGLLYEKRSAFVWALIEGLPFLHGMILAGYLQRL